MIQTQVEDNSNLSVVRDTVITLKSNFAETDVHWTWQWQDSYGPVIVRYTDSENAEQNASHYLEASAVSPAIMVREPRVATPILNTVTRFIHLGFIHIIPKGLDHILFVIGLVLLHPLFKPVLLQVTLFTVAHSITLALAMFGTIALPSLLVEAAIALSIVFIAVDNLWSKPVNGFRLLCVFLFGLLHGLGFASVLGEQRSSSDHALLSIASFNIGVELGQLAVVLLFFLTIGYWFRKRSWYGKGIRIPISIGLGCVGAWWFFERISPLFRGLPTQ